MSDLHEDEAFRDAIATIDEETVSLFFPKNQVASSMNTENM
jgi:hypothetical protein